MASTTPRCDCDCMKLSYVGFPPLIHDMKDLFVKYAFANNKEITVQALLHCLPISDRDWKTSSSQNVTDCVVEDGTRVRKLLLSY